MISSHFLEESLQCNYLTFQLNDFFYKFDVGFVSNDFLDENILFSTFFMTYVILGFETTSAVVSVGPIS